MAGPDGAIGALVKRLARLPGLGPRSARRLALYLLTHRDDALRPLIDTLGEVAAAITPCSQCGNLDVSDPCGICRDATRRGDLLCVVEQVADLWAMERTGAFAGRYFVLGGTLSALDGIGPAELGIDRLIARITEQPVVEVILALNATVDGQTTAHYVAERLAAASVRVSRLAHGVPLGGELDYLDDGTLTAALSARRPM